MAAIKAKDISGRLTFLFVASLTSNAAMAAVLPDDRVDLLYHGYDGGGAEITGPSILVRKKFADKVSISANYYVDTVSSASIDVLATASPYNEERTQTDLSAEYLNNKTTISFGYGKSTENDYDATTYHFGISQDFFGDLTTLAMGYSIGNDTVQRNGDDEFSRDLDRRQFSLSLSQILTRNMIVNLGIESIVDEGFLNNPYRSVRYRDPFSGNGYSYQPEAYPETRSSDAAAVKALYYLPYKAVLRGEYRKFKDSWDIESDSYELRYTHPFAERWIAELKFRHYQQTAAEFYSDLFPFRDAQNFLARDKELSSFTSLNYGLGITYEIPTTKISWIKKSTINLYWDFFEFDYDDFRNVTVNAAAGEEPLYSFDADVIRLYLSFWY